MTLAGLAEYPEVFSAGVSECGIVNFRTFIEHTEPRMREMSKIKYGDPDTEGELLDRLSPINKIDRVVSPVLLLHGGNDTNVPLIEAQQVAEKLGQRGVPVECIVFPDEGHGFKKKAAVHRQWQLCGGLRSIFREDRSSLSLAAIFARQDQALS